MASSHQQLSMAVHVLDLFLVEDDVIIVSNLFHIIHKLKTANPSLMTLLIHFVRLMPGGSQGVALPCLYLQWPVHYRHLF